MKSYQFVFILLMSFFDLSAQSWVSSNSVRGNNALGPIDVTVDNAGNSYALGYFLGDLQIENYSFTSKGIYDYFLASFDDNSNLRWINSIGSTGGEYPNGIIFPVNNEIYVIGTFSATCYFTNGDFLESSGSQDVFLAKYDVNGLFIEAKKIISGVTRQYVLSGDVHNDTITISGVFADSLVYPTGNNIKIEKIGTNNLFSAQFTLDGNYINAYHAGSVTGSSKILDIKVTDKNIFEMGIFTGDLEIEGTIYSSYNNSSDIFFRKINKSNLTTQWTRTINGNNTNFSSTIEVDESEDIYFTGYYESNDLDIQINENETYTFQNINKGGEDILFGKFNSNGDLIDFVFFGGMGNDRTSKILLNNNSITVTGYLSDKVVFGNDTLQTSGTINKDAFLAKFNKDLDYQWGKTIEAEGNSLEFGIDVDYNANSDLILSGYYTSSVFELEDSIYYNLSLNKSQFFIAELGCLPILHNSTTPTDLTCNNNASGSISIDGSGGFTELLYSIDGGSTFQGEPLFEGLDAGDYHIVLKDSTGCSTDGGTITLTEPPAIVIDTESSTDISCFGGADGSISVTASGGTAPLLYTLNPGAVASNNSGDFTGLEPGTYTVAVTDANSCAEVVSNPITISEPSEIVIGSESATDVTCFGAGDGTISVQASGGEGALVYTLTPGDVTNGSGDFTNLAPGTYTVTITDGTGCAGVASNPLVIDQPADIVITNLSCTNISCNNTNDGKIFISARGGNAPLSYTLSPGGATNTTGEFTGLSEGTYNVEVSDAGGCPVVVSEDKVITNPPAIVIDNETSSDISCNGQTDGLVRVNATGGTGVLTYTLQPSGTVNATGTFEGLTEGDYSVEVTDENSCPVVTSSTLSVVEPAPLAISAESATNINCFGAGDGSINVTATGGTEPLVYTLTPGDISNATGSFTDLQAGTYTVTVTDAGSCPAVVSSDLTITEPAEIVINSETSADVSCPGAADGSVTVSASGSPNLTYTLTPGDVSNSTGIFSDLSAGSYTVTVTDGSGCPGVNSSEIMVSEPAPLAIVSENKTDISCYGENNGEIQVSASGGTAPLTYSLPGGESNETGIFSGLSAGSYTVVVTDANSCSQLMSNALEVNEPAEITISSSSATDIACNGANDGEIAVVATGGAGNLSYVLNPDGTNNTSGIFTGLAAGTYSVEVADDNACLVSVNDLVINEPDEFVVDSVNHTDASSAQSVDGSISVYVSGGVEPYVFTLNGGDVQTNGIYTGISKGKYEVQVYDANDCGPLTTDTIVVVSTSAITELESGSIKVYPNPVSGRLNIEMKEIRKDKVVLTLFDDSGRMLLNKEVGIIDGRLKEVIDVSGFARGTLFLKIEGEDKVIPILKMDK